MKDRIAKIIKEEELSATKFADEIGVQASSISHILSGRNNPSSEFLIKVIERFRGINAEWLLTGRGEMYKSYSKENLPTNDIEKSSQPNLFSNTQTIKKSDEVHDINKNGIFSSEEQKVDNNIENIIKSTVKEESVKIPKAVEKIIIFFKDKSFDVYMPNE